MDAENEAGAGTRIAEVAKSSFFAIGFVGKWERMTIAGSP